MNYLKVPDSNIQLTDGSVVMLARFPGTKWVVHYGWYEYAGRRNMGWYFSSIPAQTVIPATTQDLQLIVVIDQGDVTEEIVVTNSGTPTTFPGPGPCPPSPPAPPFEPGSTGLFPQPDCASKSPVAYFSKNDKFLLDSSWITLPSIKYRDALSTIITIPDGKVVKVNNVDGKTRYYSWSAIDQRWNEKFYENDTEELLVDYYTKEEIDALLLAINTDISDFERRCSADVDELSGDVSELTRVVNSFSSTIEDLLRRVENLETALFNIQKITATSDDTVLVSQDGAIKDSGVSIGDDVIDEPTSYASSKTLATEKAVVRLVDENVAQWSLF